MDEAIRIASLREQLYRCIEDELAEDGTHKSYEGALDVVLSFPNIFERSEPPKWTITWHCYVVPESGRHHSWSGKTLTEAIAVAEDAARKIAFSALSKLERSLSMSPYTLPDGNVQIAFSGGRTSAFMLHEVLQANGPLPDRAVVTFQNTGREMPETLDFVREVGERWSVNVVWLEYRGAAPHFEIVGHNSASRNGEPFEVLIRKRKYLPNQQTRFCSIELKVRTAKRYLRSLGWKHWTNCVGLRADEPERLNKPKPKDRWTVWTPLADARVGKHHVTAFWDRQPFDLRLPNVKGKCWLGNCDGCFLKSEANIAAFTRDFPERAAWWEGMEELVSGLTPSASAAFFSKRYTRADMRQFMARQGDWALSTEGALCQADHGECAPL